MSDDEAAVSEAINKFSKALYLELSGGTENLVISPFSVSAVVSMLMMGLRGDTEKHVSQTLYLSESRSQLIRGFKSIFDSLQASEDVAIEIANKIYVQDGLHLKEEFRNDTRNYFNSVAEEVDIAGKTEEVRVAVNNWAAKKTHDKIQDLLAPGSLNGVIMILLSAIYFKGLWEAEFDKDKTRPQPFHLVTGSGKHVPMMNLTKWLPYTELKDLNVQVLKLPYKGQKFSMLIFLPRTVDGLKTLESKLDQIDVPAVLESLDLINVILALPRFKILSAIELEEALQKVGLGELFSPGADFSSVTDGEICVTKALQKAFIEVNEEGTEAAAVTVFIGCCPTPGGAGPPVINFVADRPFMYMIVEESNKTILFMGRVFEPEE